MFHIFVGSCDSTDSIVTRLQADNRGLIPGRVIAFSLFHHVQTCAGSYPASYPMGTGSLSPVLKWLGDEADHTSI
jgi:hypothetical protein